MIRGSLRQLLGSVETLNEGYEKASTSNSNIMMPLLTKIPQQYSLFGKSFVMSDPTFQPQVMLPQEHIKWFLDQPEDLVSHWTARQERHALEYLQIGVDFADTTTFLTTIIANSLSPRRMGIIQPDMLDEIRKTVDNHLGTDSDNWVEYNVQHRIDRLISTVGTRVLFGFPLCRNDRFLRAVDKFIMYMGIGTIVIGELHLRLIERNTDMSYSRSTSTHLDSTNNWNLFTNSCPILQEDLGGRAHPCHQRTTCASKRNERRPYVARINGFFDSEYQEIN